MVYDNSRNLFSGGAHDRNVFQNSKAAGKASPFPPGVRMTDRANLVARVGELFRMTTGAGAWFCGARHPRAREIAPFPFDGTTGTARREWFGLSCLNFEKSAPDVCEEASIGKLRNASVIKQRTKTLQDGPIICFNKLHFVGFGIALT